MLLISQGELFAPQTNGPKDILIAGQRVIKIADRIALPSDWEVQTILAKDKIITPGFVDLHVHLLGGGGEGGYHTRTPEICMSSIARAGVTTVVGCLGTDDVTRHPEALLAKAMQLEAEGLSTYIYTGSYHIPPPTITGSVRRDLVLIPKVVGIGEIAIADHRSSQPQFEEFCRLAAEARVGGMLGGKAGLVHLHLGDGRQGLDLIRRIVAETEIPITQFLPTHVNRNATLLNQAIQFGLQGGNIDFTAGAAELSFAVSTGQAVHKALRAGVALEQMSLSSDSNGSMPVFNARGELEKLAVADIAELFEDWRQLVKGGLPLEDALRMVTVNPARRIGIWAHKGSIATGKDADILIMNHDYQIDTVIAKGRPVIENGQIRIKGTFEA